MTAHTICLPGLGADEALFGPQREAIEGVLVPEWSPEPQARSVDDLARAQLGAASRAGVWSRSTVLVGFSFGGQVALSMARAALEEGAAPPRAVVLISSPRSPKGLTASFRAQAALSRILPGPVIRWSARRLVAERFARVCRLDGPQTRELVAMAERLDVRTFKRLARLAPFWSFDEEQEQRLVDAGVRLRHLHSVFDPVIPPPDRGRPGVELVPKRAHLLTWTYAERVNAMIRGA